jgi:hypothetical protein
MNASVDELKNPPTPELPELHGTILETAGMHQLLDDIEDCTEVMEILPKFAAQSHAPDRSALTLSEAREMLANRAVRGLQIRYRYQGADWWDTIMVLGSQFRIVRIRHDFGRS